MLKKKTIVVIGDSLKDKNKQKQDHQPGFKYLNPRERKRWVEEQLVINPMSSVPTNVVEWYSALSFGENVGNL